MQHICRCNLASARSFSTSTKVEAKKLSSPPVSQSLARIIRSQLESREAGRALDQSRRKNEEREFTNEELRRYESFITPKGAIYSPEELSFEAKRPIQQEFLTARLTDKFEEFQIDPLDEYKSHNVLSHFTTELGRIRPREATGLSAKSQRNLAKAVRRARALSILPTTARHPDFDAQNGRQRPGSNHSYITRI